MMSPHEYYAQTPGPGQAFGAPRDGGKRHHEGADFSHSTRPGTVDVPIVESGVVTGNYWTDGYGWRLVVGPWSYSHLHQRSPLNVGDRVYAGDIAGREGTTGWTLGPCCHVEHTRNGRKVDPVPVIRSILGGTPAGGNAKPLPDPDLDMEDTSMRIFSETNGSFYLAKPGGIVGIRNQRDLKLLRRLLNSKPGTEDTFNAAERDIIASYMRD